jgi:predicted Fe-S protein YdhL (DUF1289 family)
MAKNEKNNTRKIVSPCVRNCCLDLQDICVGCFRHYDEIISWLDMTDEQRQQVLIKCQQRKLQRR